jgi:hypothetical protein
LKELEMAMVKLYARILGFLSKAKQYFEQGAMSIYVISSQQMTTNCPLERTIKSAFLTELDLGSGLNEIHTAENDVDRCIALADRMGLYQYSFILP